jgi:two-component system, OmpR family, response regulator
MNRKIAIVEDDPDQRENYADALRSQGYAITAYASKEEALRGFRETLPDLAILDVMLGENHDAGFEICTELHKQHPTIPVIFLTARDSEMDRVEGLRLEAWDYLIKPITLDYLTVRVSSLFRIEERLTHTSSHHLSNDTICGELTLNETALTVHWQKEPLELTLTEFWLLEALAQSPGEAFSYESLMPVTRQTIVEKNTINGHIRRIRIKFKRIDPDFNCIRNVFGVGYRWDC